MKQWLERIVAWIQHLFEAPNQLSPQWLRNHVIRLIEGAQPPNLQPYHYPYYQKNEVEKIVREKLDSNIIWPNINPFSSLVLLFQKKDGGWRFCVDYRALNKVTITDKFPIPTIDELLYELHRAIIFSKLDLKLGYH